MQNHPPVQQHFLEGGALPKLLRLTEDPDPTARCVRDCVRALPCRHAGIKASDRVQHQSVESRTARSALADSGQIMGLIWECGVESRLVDTSLL